MTAARRAALTAGGALAALALVAGCGSSGDAAGPAHRERSPSSPPRTSGAPSRAPSPGRTREVRSIISDPAGDPHSYESTPADAAAISRADLVVANGGGYDTFVDKVTDADAAAEGPHDRGVRPAPGQAPTTTSTSGSTRRR